MIYKAIPKNGDFDYQTIDDSIPDTEQQAYIFPSGEENYFKIGESTMFYHREDGPAVVRNIPPQTFYENGLQIDIGGFDEWWIDGECITDEVERVMKAGKLNSDWKNWTVEDKAIFKLLFV